MILSILTVVVSFLHHLHRFDTLSIKKNQIFLRIFKVLLAKKNKPKYIGLKQESM